VRHPGYAVPRRSRIGRDHRCHAVPLQQAGDARNLLRVEVGRNLHRDRDAPAVGVGEPVLLRCYRPQQAVEFAGLLQLAQVPGVGR
jgi:hypothetical protein